MPRPGSAARAARQRDGRRGRDLGVAVEQQQRLASGRGEPGVGSRGEAAGTRETEDAHRGVRCGDGLGGPVRAPVVDDDHLQRRGSGGGEGGKAAEGQLAGVVGRDDDRERRRRIHRRRDGITGAREWEEHWRRRRDAEGRRGREPRRVRGWPAWRPILRRLRLAWWLAAASLSLSTLLVLPWAVDTFRLPQRMAAEWLALASLAALSLAGGGAGAAGERSAPPWRRPAVAAVVPLLLVATAGLLATAHRAHVAEALFDLWIGAAALAGWALGFSATRLRRLLDVAAIAAVPSAAIAVLQAHDLWEPMRFVIDPGEERYAITSLAGNPGDLAALLVLPALVSQANVLRAARGWRWAWLAALLLQVYALAATRTLTALAALAAGSALLWLLALPWRRRLLAAGGTAVALALVVAGGAAAARAAGGAGRAAAPAATSTPSSPAGSTAGASLPACSPSTPWPVSATARYRAEFARTKLALAAEGETFFAGHLRPTFVNVHNEYLEVGADTGWPGLLALAWGAAVLARAARRLWRAAERAAGALAWAGLAAIALLALAYFPFRLGPVAFGWIAFFAWMVTAASAAGEVER